MAESKTKISGVILSQNYDIKGLIIGEITLI